MEELLQDLAKAVRLGDRDEAEHLIDKIADHRNAQGIRMWSGASEHIARGRLLADLVLRRGAA